MDIASKPENVLSTVAENAVEGGFDDLIHSFVIESLELVECGDQFLITLEQSPKDLDSLNGLFRVFHTVKGNAAFLNIDPCVAQLAHEAEDILTKCRSDEMILQGDEFLLILECAKALRSLIECVGGGTPFPPELQLLVETLVLRLTAYKSSAGAPPKLEGNTPERHSAAEGEHDESYDGKSNSAESKASSGPVEQKTEVDSSKTAEKRNLSNETIRVDRSRLDQLVSLVGELVIAESMAQRDMLDSRKDNSSSSSRDRNFSQLNRITRSLQQLSLSLRMVPLKSTFQKMTRVARDLNRKLGKSIDFAVEGEETELDKTVVDEIGDPLMHMVRNAIDHGIENSSEERLKAGKPAKGKVTLRAFHQSGNIHIEIEDDGRGLDTEKLMAKARKLGLIADDAVLSEQEAFQLIFEPGFSTAEKVTDVSGRGVGMDVVRRNILSLRGSIDIRSKVNCGSCFTIKLPLTLAIIDGMVVRCGASRFIIPTLSVTELMKHSEASISTFAEKNAILSFREKTVPLIDLRKQFALSLSGVEKGDPILVVVQDGEKYAALKVDEVLGQQQVVIKQLGYNMDHCAALAGGAIMPDGNIGIILDVHGTIQAFESGI